jgi:hypothetical protein
LQTNVTAFLAYGGLTWDDVTKVEVSGSDAAWKAILNNQADAMSAFTTGDVNEVASSPRGLSWISTPHSETENWARMQAVAPHMAQRVATVGLGLSEESPLECGGFPYPILVTAPDQDAKFVGDVASGVTAQFENFVAAEPSAGGWAMERQNFEWVLPYHAGAVAFWKSQGVWTDAAEAYNEQLLKRQSVMAEAWDAMEDKKSEGFQDRWMAARLAALTAANLPAYWEK